MEYRDTVKPVKIEARPWTPQDLLDDLQLLIDEEPNNYLNIRRTIMETALAYLKEHFAEEEGGWIPVSSERKPQHGQEIQVYVGNVMAPYVTTQHYWTHLPISHTVTHWKPLSDPPKEEKK